ncbi:MAG: hypothetical protein GF307_09915 [candidate division Zixibacteria bacterium]|nr:hypothetical protein [candidate division Zixibacteria bacterium]
MDVILQDSIQDRWLLDTGAGVQIVSQALFDQLDMVPAGHFTAFRMTGERFDVELFGLRSLQVAGYRKENVLVALWPVLDSMGISGIVSLKFFEDRALTIDFVDNSLTVETATSVERIAGNGTVVPIETQRYRDSGLDIFAVFKLGDSFKAEFEIDTGSGRRLWIDSRFLSKLAIDTTSDTVTKKPTDTGSWYITYLDRVSLWDSPSISTDSVRAIFRDNLIYDGVIGIGFWTDRAITIDIPNHRMIVR